MSLKEVRGIETPVAENVPTFMLGKQDTCVRVPKYSRSHNIIPRRYVMEWRTDMTNRELICKNADLGALPNYEHDDNLFLEKREQMHYNVENRERVDSKYKLPPRRQLLNPPRHHPSYKKKSPLMQYTE